MSSELPGALRAAVERELQGVSRKGLPERAARISNAYRGGGTSSGAIRDGQDALAYALTRLPATYAACAAAFAQAARAVPDFQPRSLLDAGAGPAAASWAAQEAWPGLQSVTWLDANLPFLELAARLAVEGPTALAGATRQRADLTAGGPWPRADLVAASYALAEIPPDRQAQVVAGLWAACDGVLALVEPGTSAGYARILAARQALIEGGAMLLAPCPHARPCPLVGEDWCHFTVRLPRSREHRLAKDAVVPFEDEKFAYLIAARPALGAAPGAARILAHPRARKPGIEFKLCTPAGRLETRFVPRRDKLAHARARRLGWGDVFEG